jgi:hypothetical protein
MTRRRGRPPLDLGDPRSVSVHVRLPAQQYDALCQRLRFTRETVSQTLRRALAVELRSQK